MGPELGSLDTNLSPSLDGWVCGASSGDHGEPHKHHINTGLPAMIMQRNPPATPSALVDIDSPWGSPPPRYAGLCYLGIPQASTPLLRLTRRVMRGVKNLHGTYDLSVAYQ